MPIRRRFFFLCFFFISPILIQADAPDFPAPAPDATAYDFLGAQMQKSIADLDWGGGQVAILIEDGAVPLKVFGMNEKASLQPGPLMQIVTAAAALERLGPDFTFHTDLALAGPIEKGTLAGDLIVRGDGDPSLSSFLLKRPEDAYGLFDRWAKLLRKHKCQRVQGRVIGDGRAFDNVAQAPGWLTGKLGPPEYPSIAALSFNDNCVDIYWKKGRKEGPAEFELFPRLPKYVFFASNVRRAALPRADRHYERPAEGNVISALGELPLGTEAHERASIENPERFFAEAFKARLAERKIAVQGAAVSGTSLSPGEIPEQSTLLDRQASPALADLLGRMMRYDQTLSAEVALKTMGRKATGKPGSFQSGAEAVEQFLDGFHLPGSAPLVADGSGRSSADRLSAVLLVDLTRRMLRGLRAKAFEGLFPRAGEPGILAERFQPFKPAAAAQGKKKKEPVREPPRIWAKAASTEGVEGLAGWVRTRSGRRLIFAMMVNGSTMPPPALRAQLDALALDLADSVVQ